MIIEFLERKRKRLLLNLKIEKDIKIQKIKAYIMIQENKVKRLLLEETINKEKTIKRIFNIQEK